MVGQLVLALVLVAGALGQRCYLPNVPVDTNVDEGRLAGRWYEIKYHAANAKNFDFWNGKYSDYYMDLIPRSHYGYNYNYLFNQHHMSSGFQINDIYHETLKGQCRTEVGAWNRVDASKPGKYYDTVWDSMFPGNQEWIMETDYTSYMIKLHCLKPVGDYCEETELAIWARTADYSGELRRRIEVRVRELLGVNPCISYAYVVAPTPHSNPKKCVTPEPTTYPHGYPYGLNYWNNYYGHSGRMGGLMSHPDLIVPMKEMLIAQKAKLVSEKAQMLVMKEKLQLEIARLRGVAPVAGGPKV